MENIIARLLRDFEQGKMSRRQLIQSLAVTASAASAVSVAQAAPTDGNRLIKAVNLNHNSYQVADYKKTRDFYSDVLGMTVSEDDGKQCRLTFGNNIIVARTRGENTPRVDHVAYTLADWDQKKEEILAELKRRKVEIMRGDTKTSLHILDPDGFEVQIGGLRQ